MTCASQTSSRPPGAFTLVEMLVVLAVLSVFAGAMAASLAGRRRPYVVAAAAETLAADIRLAAGGYLRTGRPYRVSCDGSGHRVERAAPEDPGRFEPAPGKPGRRKPLGRGLAARAMAMESDRLRAFPLLFAPADRFSGRVFVTAPRGETAWMEVFGETGQVLVHRRPAE